MTPEFLVQTIGRVRSSLQFGEQMPADGVPAQVEVYPEFELGLVDLASNSHVWVIAWLANADRTRLNVSNERGGRGVFALRSSARPNPIGLTVSRLLAVRGRTLELERLDFFDGTPVIDLKRYSPGWDDIMSAWTPRDRRPPTAPDDLDQLEQWLHQAATFRGAVTPELAAGVRILHDALVHFALGPRDPLVMVSVGRLDDVADALQALTGATFGNGRLRVRDDGKTLVAARGAERYYLVRSPLPSAAENVLRKPLSDIVHITDTP